LNTPHDLRDGLGGFAVPDAHRELLRVPAWITPTIIVVNVAVFVAMAWVFHSVTGFIPLQLAAWGGNSGALDVQGQWWRLLSYQFLHANIVHLGLNMWVMWSVGRLTERLYGSFALLFIYLSSGALAGLASIVWNPDIVSVGASGSIFGVFGALLALLFLSQDEVPMPVLRYWLPITLFVAFNLVSGFREPGIDNAAHVGGLFAGVSIGAIMVRPLDSKKSFPVRKTLLATLFAGACAILPLWYMGTLVYRPSSLAQFADTHRWYIDQEMPNLQLWQSLALQADSGTISNDDLGKRFEKDILPFWVQADARLRKELKSPGSQSNPFLAPIADFARLRLAWAKAIIEATRNPQSLQAALDDAQQTDLAQARLDRMKLRVAAETLPPPLAESQLAIRFLRLIPGLQPNCVVAPARIETGVAATDAPGDGPAARRAVGCLAQRLFLAGDYKTLDKLMNDYSGRLSDLPDGSSRFEGIVAGLYDLFDYGGLTVDSAMRRTADWRRATNDSIEAELVEVLMFRSWAYTARGHGDASTITPQGLELFTTRSEMAAAGLRQEAVRAQGNPLWYQLSIGVDRDQSIPVERTRPIFDRGMARFPAYLPLYRQMLTNLMPRWLGSVENVEAFIADVSRRPDTGQIDPALYARLYLIYGDLEGEDFNVILNSRADPVIFETGLAMLLRQYPGSDYILNSVARLDCIDHEWSDYKVVRSSLRRVSATAWPGTVTLATCDRWS
jgi:rhomboid protease GluP